MKCAIGDDLIKKVNVVIRTKVAVLVTCQSRFSRSPDVVVCVAVR